MNELTVPQPSVENPEPFLTKTEMGKRLGICQRTIDDWMKRGLLPYYKVGRSVRFKWSEVEHHLSETCRVSRRRRPIS